MEIFTFSERLWRVENNALVCLLCPTNSDCTSQYRPELVGQRPGQHTSQSSVRAGPGKAELSQNKTET